MDFTPNRINKAVLLPWTGPRMYTTESLTTKQGICCVLVGSFDAPNSPVMFFFYKNELLINRLLRQEKYFKMEIKLNRNYHF